MIRVAAYCRVSTEQEDQANSFQAQQRFFREYIASKPQWELYGIYADEGISGTLTKNRPRFNHMIRDASEGRFQLILTKEVSRFSRNILDAISCTRELKRMGVAVLFLTDGICTTDPDAELRLSIMASLAQEESRRTSSRVTWGQTRQMERGVVFGHSLLGYDVRNGRITVNTQGSEIVRLIFRKYALEQLSANRIAEYLRREGYQTARGGTCWTGATVLKILKNEKYTGDLIQKKTFTPDYLTHEKRRNTGEVPLICLKDHHEPIVSRELWELTQRKLEEGNKHRAGEKTQSTLHAFSGKIRCGQCGGIFVCRYRYRKDGSKIRRWCCGKALREGTSGCDIGKLLTDADARYMVKTVISGLPLDRRALADQVAALIESARSAEATTEKRLEQLRRKKEAMMDSYFAGEISREEMLSMKGRYDTQMQQLAEAGERRKTGSDPEKIRSQVIDLLEGRQENDLFFRHLTEHLTVHTDRSVEVKLQYFPYIFKFVDNTK